MKSKALTKKKRGRRWVYVYQANLTPGELRTFRLEYAGGNYGYSFVAKAKMGRMYWGQRRRDQKKTGMQRTNDPPLHVGLQVWVW